MMTNMTSSPFTRPTSVMSLLADQMQSSCINEMSLIENIASEPISFKPVSNDYCNISSSAPTHRYSIPDTCFNCLNSNNDSMMEQECILTNESDLSSPQLPSKRLCHSSTNDGYARPIPIKINIKSHYNNHIHETSSHFDHGNKYNRITCPKPNMTIKTPQRNPGNCTIRTIISPHYKKSAFTPTRSLTSPQTTSSDYSISPDIESPIHRPASLTSSGFHDSSQQSLLIDPNYSPDSNERSNCATIINTQTPDTNQCMFPRCHSQPCDELVSRNFSNRSIIRGTEKTCSCNKSSSKYTSQIHTTMKRRYPSMCHIRSTSHPDSTNAKNIDSPIHCHCNKQLANSADTSPNACGSLFTVPKRDGYFFGGGRSYLISLPRIASSPPPTSLQVDPQTVTQGQRQRIGSNSSSLSTSTTTDANTPTVISNGNLQPKIVADSTDYNGDSIEDVDMVEPPDENRSTMIFMPDYPSYDNFEPIIDKDPPHLWSDMNFVPSATLGNLICPIVGSSCSVSTTSDLTTKSYSTTSDCTSNCTNISHSINSEESSRSELRDPDDPPEIVVGFFQSNNHQQDSMIANFEENSSFQELDIDQIELD